MNIVLPHKNIKDFEVKDDILSFYMIKSCEVKTSSTGAKYLNITLGDAGGEINAKLWDCPEGLAERLTAGTIVRIMGTVIEYQGSLQLKLEKIRPAREEDNIDPADFVQTAPYSSEEMYGYLYDTAKKFKNDSIRNITVNILEKNKSKLMYYPAAKKNHHAIMGGLLYHTSTMLKTAHKVCEIYDFLDKELLFAGVILHDMAKIDEMDSNQFGLVDEYTPEGNLIGHLVKGAMNISKEGERVNADKEIVMLLCHMILAHHYEPEYGSPKYPCTPEAEMLHHLDLIDARMFDMKRISGDLKKGEFSEKIWSLEGRQIYKAKI